MDNYTSTNIKENIELNIERALAHFGRLGMKWRVRKNNTRTSIDHHKTRMLSKDVSKLSNEQISTLVKRLQLEKSLKDISPSRIQKGEDVAKRVLSIGTTIASLYALSKTPLGEAIKNRFSNRPR